MSESNGSEEEFFDACDELDSPKLDSPSAVSLVTEESEKSEGNTGPKNLPIGDLSLDHFDNNEGLKIPVITPDEPLTPTNQLPIQSQKNVENNEILSAKPETKSNVDSHIESEFYNNVYQNETSSTDECRDSNIENVFEIELNNEQSVTGSSDGGQEHIKFDNSLTETTQSAIEDCQITLRNTKPDAIRPTSEIPINRETSIEISDNSFKVSSIERPKSLPVGTVEIPEIVVPNTVHVDKKPKRPPPPRPKGPPPSRPVTKRDSVKSTGKPGKPYISALDDGLLTPNSTVNNITSEFVEALNKKSSPPKKSKSISLPNRKSTSKTNSLSSSINSNGRDDEVLSSVIVKNLDTGETMPLSSAAEHCLNPLALQIMSRTKEFSFVDENSPGSSGQNSTRSSVKAKHNLSDEDVTSLASDEITIGGDAEKNIPEHKPEKRKKRLKKFIGKRMIKVKTATSSGVEKAVQKVKQARKHENLTLSSDEELSTETSQTIKIKASQSNKGPYYMFSKIRQVQDITVHVGAVWCMKFSHCGRLLATAGQDNVIWVWVLSDYHSYFSDMRSRYDTRDADTLFGVKSTENIEHNSDGISGNASQGSEEEEAPFQQIPFSSYVGHSADVLDLAWSKNYFILSSSMDKTVRLWHISRKECLCCFQHIDFVTAISFHPRDDRYFLSGSLDGKLRLWNIPEKKVALWNEISSDTASATGGALITTVNFCENGKFAVCGTYDGRCIFYETEHFKYHTQIHVRSSRGRNNKGHKITGIESLPGEHKLLVTSNDSRIRLYDLRDLSMTCKYKGLTNLSSQIKASFSHDLKYIICGSEDKCVYVWPTNVPQDMTKLSSLRRDRNECWENLKAHNAVVTCAIFAPKPDLLIKKEPDPMPSPEPKETKLHAFMSTKKSKVATSRVLISADFNGEIKVFVTE